MGQTTTSIARSAAWEGNRMELPEREVWNARRALMYPVGQLWAEEKESLEKKEGDLLSRKTRE